MDPATAAAAAAATSQGLSWGLTQGVLGVFSVGMVLYAGWLNVELRRLYRDLAACSDRHADANAKHLERVLVGLQTTQVAVDANTVVTAALKAAQEAEARELAILRAELGADRRRSDG